MPLVLLCCALLMAGAEEIICIRVHDQAAVPIAPHLLGQFLERNSNGEPGPEAFADPATGRLPPPVMDLLRGLRPPLLRFPGGTDVDFLDWSDLIDGVPGRSGGRPVSRRGQNSIGNRFGVDECHALGDELGCATILVVNLLDALCDPAGPQAALERSLGLLAYANAPLGADLPPALAHWPAVRAANGHPRPFGCRYVQLGNEIGFKSRQFAQATGLAGDDLARHVTAVYRAAIALACRIDPEVGIILDGELGGLEETVLADAQIRAATPLVTFHRYGPGRLDRAFALSDEAAPRRVPLESLTPAQWWDALCILPAQVDAQGQTLALAGPAFRRAVELGYRCAVTEWNWNGWELSNIADPGRDAWLPMARVLGAAGFLHGLVRQQEHIALATQSMLLGSRWEISAVLADPAGKRPPRLSPTGLAASLYAGLGGQRLLAVEIQNMVVQPQGHVVGQWTKWPEGVPRLADLDVLACATGSDVRIFILQRSWDQERQVRLDLDGLGPAPVALRHRLVRRRQPGDTPGDGGSCVVVEAAATMPGRQVDLRLPPQTLHVLDVKGG